MRWNSGHDAFGVLAILNEVLADIIAVALAFFDCVGWAVNYIITIIE